MNSVKKRKYIAPCMCSKNIENKSGFFPVAAAVGFAAGFASVIGDNRSRAKLGIAPSIAIRN